MSLKIKIAAISLLTSFVLIAVFVYADYQNQQKILKMKSDDIVNNINSGIRVNMDSTLNHIETALTVITENKEVQRLVSEQNYEELNNMLQPAYQKLKAHGFANGHFHTPDSITILRLHKPESLGDDLSSFRFLVNDANRDKKMIKGIEEGKSGLMLRIIEPINYENSHVGTFEMGIEFGIEFIKELKQYFGGEHFVFNFGTISTKSEEEKLKGFMAGTISDDPTSKEEQNYLEEVKTNKTVSFVSNDGQFEVILTPYLNYNGEVAGYIKSIVSREAINQMASSYYKQLFTVLAIVLMLALILAWVFANSIAKPLIALKKAADQVTSGDMEVTLPKAGNDEVGALTSSMEMLIASIKFLKKDK